MKKQKEVYSIEDLKEEDRKLFCICLEDWSEEMKEAGDHKARWCSYMENRSWGAKLAKDSSGRALGMIQYYPAEYSSIEGPGLYFIQCVWIPKGKGIPKARKKGLGKRLLAAAEEDIRSKRAQGVATWGVTIPVWMKSAWYKKQGYQSAGKQQIMELVWKSFTENAEAPRFRKPAKEIAPVNEKGQLLIYSFINGVCPAMNIGAERAAKMAATFGEALEFRQILTREPEVLKEWGIGDALYIAGKEIPLGPPPSEKKLKGLIRKALKKQEKK